MLENPGTPETSGMPETLALTQFLKVVLALQVIVLLVVVIAVGEKGDSADAAAAFVVNGALTLVKAAVILGVVRALNRGSKVACYVVMVTAVAGVVFVIATFEPDRSIRALGLKEFQYVLNVVNLVLACAGAYLAIRTLMRLKALEVPAADGPVRG